MAISLGICTAACHSTEQPNVLLILTDDQGYGDISAHGNSIIATPTLDRLYERSIRFTNFHASATCSPTRAALLTGRYSNATGVWHTIMGRSLLNEEELTLADCFRSSGYRTGIFGKWHLGENYPFRPQDRGFDEVLVHGGGAIGNSQDYFGNDYFDDTYLDNGKLKKFEGYCTDVWFEGATRFIDETSRRGEPFFCYLATNAPHKPFRAPDEYVERYQEHQCASRLGMITNIDDNLGRLVDFLTERDLLQNTIMIFMTDNGASQEGVELVNAGMRPVRGIPTRGASCTVLSFLARGRTDWAQRD